MYYTLESSAEPTIHGCYPQITLADYSKEEIIHNLNLDELWSEEVIFDFFKFNDKFIQTDFCTISHFNVTCGLVISEKGKKILEHAIKNGYKFTSHKFFPLLISNKTIPNKYYFLQILNSKEVIDYSMSFFENQLTDEEITIANHDEYNDELYAIEIKVKEGFDLFKHPYDGETFISERLKKLIEQNNLSGHKEFRIADDLT